MKNRPDPDVHPVTSYMHFGQRFDIKKRASAAPTARNPWTFIGYMEGVEVTEAPTLEAVRLSLRLHSQNVRIAARAKMTFPHRRGV